MATKKDVGEFELNLSNAIGSKPFVDYMKDYFNEAHAVMNGETFDEIKEIVFEGTAGFVHFGKESELDRYANDIEVLKDKLLIHLYCRSIHRDLMQFHQIRGPKSDRLRRFFDSISNEPVDAYDLADQYFIAYTTLKNHRRYDLFPERGLTKIKNGKIFRMK